MSNADQLISIPLKGTTEINFNDPLSQYFTKQVGIKDKTKISFVCSELTCYRAQATNIRNIQQSPTGLQLISRYANSLGLRPSCEIGIRQ